MNKYRDFLLGALLASGSFYKNAAFAEKQLKEAGFTESLDSFSFLVNRGGGAILAVRMPKKLVKPYFKIYAAHIDSPCLKLKANPVLRQSGCSLVQCEPYGGLIYASFFDRPLWLSGMVYVQEKGKLIGRLFDSEAPFAYLPRLAIHYDREVNSHEEVNADTGLRPIVSNGEDFDFDAFLRSYFPTAERILSHDLYLVLKDKPAFFGQHEDLLFSPRLDDLGGAYPGLYGFLESSPAEEDEIQVLSLFASEEVGSATYFGASGGMMAETLSRLAHKRGFDLTEALPRSFLVSSDGAHAGHPTHPELEDKTVQVRLGRGIAIKRSASSAYSTYAASEALAKAICLKEGIPYQDFSTRSDLRSGSTLASISNSRLSLPSVDLGIPMLGMHSGVEIASYSDLFWMERFAKAYFATPISFNGLEMEIGK